MTTYTQSHKSKPYYVHNVLAHSSSYNSFRTMCTFSKRSCFVISGRILDLIYLYFISQIYIITLSANNLRKTSQERDKVQFNFNTSEILTESKCPLTFQKIKTFLNFCYQLRMVKIETSLVAHTSTAAQAYSSLAHKNFSLPQKY